MKRAIHQIVDLKTNLEMKQFIYPDGSSAQDFIESALTICFCLYITISGTGSFFPNRKFESCPTRRAVDSCESDLHASLKQAKNIE